MDKFHVLYNELACNFGIGLEPFRGPFKAALDAYIDERIGLVKPVEGKNAAVSTEGNGIRFEHPIFDNAEHPATAPIFKWSGPTQPHFTPLDCSIGGCTLYIETTGNLESDKLAKEHIMEWVRIGMDATKLVVFPVKKTVPLPVVGRCKDCKHWKQLADSNQNGQCDFIALEKADVFPEDGSSLIITRREFGCVHFQAKGGA